MVTITLVLLRYHRDALPHPRDGSRQNRKFSRIQVHALGNHFPVRNCQPVAGSGATELSVRGVGEEERDGVVAVAEQRQVNKFEGDCPDAEDRL